MALAIEMSANLFMLAAKGATAKRWTKAVAGVAILFFLVAVTLLIISRGKVDTSYWMASMIAGSFAIILTGVLAAFQVTREVRDVERTLQEAATAAYEHPDEPQKAWDLARLKLEAYLNRNLNQVRNIFWLTSFSMLLGFGLIVWGVSLSFRSPEIRYGPALATGSGIVVNFIGASFLFVYRSTMAQAQSYVNVLERINAVGMAVQILDTIETEHAELRNRTRALVARSLLSMYGGPEIAGPKKPVAKKRR